MSYAAGTFDLLTQLDKLLIAKNGIDWPSDGGKRVDINWKTNFLAWAVAMDMQHFVRTTLARSPGSIRKPNRPLHHCAAWYRSTYPSATMAEILLDAGADPLGKFEEVEEKIPVWSKSALESMQLGDIKGNGQSHANFIKILAACGADVLPCVPSARSLSHGERVTASEASPTWTTILHWIMAMKLPYMRKIEILESIGRREPPMLNAPDSEGCTVFDILISQAQTCDLSSSHILLLKGLGALLTTRLVQALYATEVDEVTTRKVCPEHVRKLLLLPEFQNGDFFEKEAKRLRVRLNGIRWSSKMTLSQIIQVIFTIGSSKKQTKHLDRRLVTY